MYHLRDLNKKGFTLSEVLIALAIIGVVAAIVIPVAMNAYRNNDYITSLKKFYYAFNGALANMAQNMGCPNDLKCTQLFGTTPSTHLAAGEALGQYLQFSKVCGATAGEGDCWATNTNLGGTSPNDYDSVAGFRAITNDGMSIRISVENSVQNSSCKKWGNPPDDSYPMSKLVGYAYVDINGFKGPNRNGRDVFHFAITNPAKIMPLMNYDNADAMDGTCYSWRSWSRSYCKDDSTGAGTGCTARIMEEGWQMTY